MNKNIPLLLLGGGLMLGTWAFWSNANDQSSAEKAYEAAGPEKVELSTEAAKGRLAFNQNCAICHGRDAVGGEGGPPLIHKIYEPSHHGDGAFYLAAQRGVHQHHWKFGNMPAQPQMTEEAMTQIIAFVRETQRANGIF